MPVVVSSVDCRMKHFTLFTALLAFSLCLPALTQNKPKSLPKDIPSLKALAEQGDAEAQYMLGAAYYFGEGIDVDFKLGTDWYKKSAKQGNPNAQYSLGAAYWYGKGVPKDRVQTYMWWTLSAGSGHALAKEWMPKITPHLTAAQIADAKILASILPEDRKRVQRLAKLGYWLSDYNRMGVSFPPSEADAKLMEFFIKKYPRRVRDY